MPKLLTFKNGSSIPNTIKIWKTYYSAPSDFLIPPMKRSVRPLFSILLLIAFAAALGCRAVVRRGLEPPELERRALVHPRLPLFNATLLKYAAIDPSEDNEKREVEQLLEGNFNSPGRYRTFSTWRRFNRQDVRTRNSKGSLLMLRSPTFYRYWLEFRKVLRDWKRGKRFQPEIMSHLVRAVKNPIDRSNGVVDDSGKKYASCAVVGNSGILLKKEYGGLIDSHEVVIRLNNARVVGYEKYVGSKTSISFVNSNILHLCARREGCFCHPYGANVPIVMYICQPIHFMDYAICNSSHEALLLVTDPRFDVLCSRIVKYYSLKRFVEKTRKSLDEWDTVHDSALFHYSSGMQAVVLALGICDKVSLFGFGKSASAKHHYHTNQRAELKLHDYGAEYEFYHDLVKKPQEIPILLEKFKVPPVTIYR